MTFVRAAVLAVASLSASAALADGLDQAVLDEINWARAHPAEYARELRQLTRSASYDRYASPGDDDPQAVSEAIAFLERQTPLAPLENDHRIAAAAREHASAQGRRGDVGHGPAGSLGVRLRENGVWAGMSAENISYGYDDPREVVRQLIVDSGVPGRGHRRNIFNGAYRSTGVACGPHRQWRAMCVIDFAGAVVQR